MTIKKTFVLFFKGYNVGWCFSGEFVSDILSLFYLCDHLYGYGSWIGATDVKEVKA